MKHLFLLLLAATTLVACKKDAKIERNLVKGDGVWDIETMTNKTTVNGAEVFNMTVPNYGTLTFRKEGQGTAKYTVAGNEDVYPFTYTNTEDQLTIVMDGSTEVFNMTWEKNAITLISTTTNEVDGDVTVETNSMSLKKR